MLRGEEERGSMDVLLSLPREPRAGRAAEAGGAVDGAAAMVGCIIGLLTLPGGARVCMPTLAWAARCSLA